MGHCTAAPHHITSIFVPHTSGPPEEQGSTGAGIAVEPPARACISSGARIPTTTARRALELLGWEGSPGIEVHDPLPPGAGYSVSASTSVAAALALAAYRGLGVRRALQAAHVAEVLESTGLGDVLAISCGVGIVVRTRPGPPGVGEAECHPMPSSVAILSFDVGRMHTRSLIREAARYREAAERRLARIIEDPSIETFIRESQEFTLEVGAHRVMDGWERLQGTPGLIGFYFKKRVAVVLVEADMVQDAVAHLSLMGVRARILQPARWPYCIGGCM